MTTTLLDREAIFSSYEMDGFVVVEDVFDPDVDFADLIADYEEVLEGIARRWHEEGIISSDFAGQPFETRLISIMSETDRPWIDYFNISMPLWGVTHETPFHYSEPIFRIMTDPRLLDVIEMFIGGEILANPIQHLRVKAPEFLIPKGKQHALNARTNWHQDMGVTLEEANQTGMITAWIPITDATEDNGCLRFIPGSHRDALAEHCPRTDGDIEIPPELRGGTVVKAPMKKGGVMFLHPLVKHDSARNETRTEVRWSYDLRYQPIGQPTGRPEWPGFVARSRKNPESVVTDHREVERRWLETRSWMASTNAHLVRRWKGGTSPYCGF
jgi:ectoine hydroxylase-related dioxygenase (phytanoyl-CoA dioxygenase family)